MFVFMLQAILLLAIAFILGSVAGCLLRTQLSAPPRRNRKPAAAPVAPPPAQTAPAQKPTMPEPAAKKPSAGRDDLKRIKGIGRQIEAKLNDAGITSYEQIAGWTKGDVAEWSEKLTFSGRVERDDWVGQARKLARGEA